VDDVEGERREGRERLAIEREGEEGRERGGEVGGEGEEITILDVGI
jgi:hypothetical protein